MIVKTTEGHEVKSEGGKPMSKPNLSLADAMRRLAQIEYFKHRAPSGGAQK